MGVELLIVAADEDRGGLGYKEGEDAVCDR
jgi:hypothetical protein